VTLPRVSQAMPLREKSEFWVMRFLGDTPTTQVRVIITLACVIVTTAKYVLSPTWQPSYEWLAFLLVMSGLDAAQFFGKRKTDAAYVAATQGATPLPDPDPPSPSA
jgi:hypothetical protein